MYKGVGKYPLLQHCDKQREIFMLIKEASEYPSVSRITANKTMRIRRLLESIMTTDQSLSTAKQIIYSNTSTN